MIGGLLLVLASASGAGWSSAEVAVEWSHGRRDKIIVGDTIWRCDGDTCRGRVVDTPLLKLRSCRAIARFAGRVTRYASASGELSADDLARCNGGR